MKKIVHLQLLPLLSGAQRVCLDELEHLDSKGFERFLICSSVGALTEEAEKLGVTCIIVPELKRNISIKYDFLAFCKIFSIFHKYKFDIVHTHSSKPGVLGRVAGRICGVKNIYHTVHGFSFPAAKTKKESFLYRLMEIIGTKCSHRVIFLHEGDECIAKEKLYMKPSKSIILPNAVDINKFCPAIDLESKNVLKRELGIESDSILIGMVGRLWQQKNPLALLNSAIHILQCDQNIDINFVFVGDGELFSAMKSTIEAHNFQNKIHLVGWRSDTESILKSFDIFVLPSLWEGMPLAILEAQSTGLACIVSDIAGNNSLVEDASNGLLFNLDEENDLTNKILFLISNPKKRLEYGIQARSKVLNYHDLNARIETLVSFYNTQ
ncbi:glycosyl transferase [Pectobacterium carotovorum subsp. carotovorum]|nr:glycosyl transferase [Pectobacterium carotovorum subsp. carotovorum]